MGRKRLFVLPVAMTGETYVGTAAFIADCAKSFEMEGAREFGKGSDHEKLYVLEAIAETDELSATAGDHAWGVSFETTPPATNGRTFTLFMGMKTKGWATYSPQTAVFKTTRVADPVMDPRNQGKLLKLLGRVVKTSAKGLI